MVLLDELKVELAGYRPQIKELHDVLDIDGANRELEELRQQIAMDGFWDNVENSQKVMQRTRNLESKIESLEKLSNMLEDTIALIELSIEEDDDSSIDEIVSEAEKFKEKLEEEKLATLLTGEYDSLNAIVTFHAGAGGTEAQEG